MLTAARREYEQQSRLTALAVHETQRIAQRGSRVIATAVRSYQAAAVALALGSMGSTLAEQGIDATQEAAVVPVSLLTEARPLAAMVDQAESDYQFSRIVETLVRDAGRTAIATALGATPAVTGYVRSLTPPSCGRCAVLAGRVYRYSTGFQRHPRCDCLMTPTTEAIGRNLVTDPADAYRKGQIRGLSEGDRFALDNGADIGQVVNVRRKEAGLTVGSSVMVRAGRLTPQGCLMFGSDRADALRLLKVHGYVK